jgi:hypothetical protein
VVSTQQVRGCECSIQIGYKERWDWNIKVEVKRMGIAADNCEEAGTKLSCNGRGKGEA